jgi:hypothetical protein
VIKDLHSNAAKGRTLVSILQSHPFLESYFRSTFDDQSPVPLAINKALAAPAIYGKEAIFAARRVNKGDLKCGLTGFIVNKAFEKCGLRPLVGQEKMPGPLKANTEGIIIELADAEPPVVNGSICFNGIKIGSCQFELPSHKLQAALVEFRRLGIFTYTPTHVERGIKNANRSR